ncbi:MAG: hypothetical protein U1F36_15360 [Planctomycetota bacterium]
MPRVLAITCTCVLLLLLGWVACGKRRAPSPLDAHPEWHVFHLASDPYGTVRLDGETRTMAELQRTFHETINRDGGGYLVVWRPDGWPKLTDPMVALELAFRAGLTMFRATGPDFVSLVDATDRVYACR